MAKRKRDDSPSSPDALLTITDVARRLKVKAKSLYNWRAEGLVIPGEVRLRGGAPRFRPEIIEEWIASGGARDRTTPPLLPAMFDGKQVCDTDAPETMARRSACGRDHSSAGSGSGRHR